MRLLVKQKAFRLRDTFYIFDGNMVPQYFVEWEPAFGRKLVVYDTSGEELGFIQRKVFSLLPEYGIYIQDMYIGKIRRVFGYYPKYKLDFCGWQAIGGWTARNFSVFDGIGNCVATVSKKLLKLTDTYEIDIFDGQEPLYVLMLVLAMDAIYFG